MQFQYGLVKNILKNIRHCIIVNGMPFTKILYANNEQQTRGNVCMFSDSPCCFNENLM